MCTCLREGKERREEEEEAYRVERRSSEATAANGWVSGCRVARRGRRDEDEARRDETRRDRSGREEGEGGERKRERERRRGILEAEPRAYDIKHYNYYLNSSRMAPGVAALLFSLSLSSSPSPRLILVLRRSLLFRSLLRPPVRRGNHRRNLPFHSRSRSFLLLPLLLLLVWPHSHALFALVYRSPLRIPLAISFCSSNSLRSLAPPARRRDPPRPTASVRRRNGQREKEK